MLDGSAALGASRKRKPFALDRIVAEYEDGARHTSNLVRGLRCRMATEISPSASCAIARASSD
jgi:hypothetical protein